MPAGLIVPGDSRPGGALSGVATQSKHGQQDLKVVPTPKARPGFEIDTSNLNMYVVAVLQEYRKPEEKNIGIGKIFLRNEEKNWIEEAGGSTLGSRWCGTQRRLRLG